MQYPNYNFGPSESTVYTILALAGIGAFAVVGVVAYGVYLIVR